jgi:L-iditol 2-dehydrogenase
MLAAVIEGPGALTVRQVPLPQAAGLALVRVAVAGICGTDRKLAAGAFPVTAPRVLGHEMTGWVEAGVPGGTVAAGTPVVVNPAAFCGVCRECRRDLPQLCGRGGLLGRDLDGCFAEYVAVPEARLHPLPAGVTADQAALVQVLSTCVHAQSGVTVTPEDGAVVIGLGVSGLLHLQLLRAAGVRRVVGVTRAAWKADLALACGASLVVAPDGAAAAVAEVTGGHGADIAIEAAGSAAALAQAIRLAAPGGTVILFGTLRAADGVPAYEGYLKELTIRCPRASRPRDFDTAIGLCAAGLVAAAPLVTGRFPLADVAQALGASEDPAQLKVLLDVAGPCPG